MKYSGKLRKFRHPLIFRKISGSSMEPTARHGQLVIASSLLKSKTDKTVIIRHNKIDKIKRIVNVKQDEIYVLGDNPAASTDSRVFGWLPKSCIIATVIWPKK